MLDHDTFHEVLADEVRASSDFMRSLQRLLEWGEQSVHHVSWAALRALDCSGEPGKVDAWLARVLKRSPCPFPVRAIYMGLGERMTRARVEYTDLYLGFLGNYKSSDKKASWLWRYPRHYPSNAYFRSEPLRAAGVICNEDEVHGLGPPGHLVFSLSFAALLARFSLNEAVCERLSGAEPIGVVMGFDSGDLFRLGEIQSGGFSVSTGPMTAA